MHSTTKLDDGYIGSGLRLRRSIRKYGTQNFKKEILEFCNNLEHLKQREKEIINLELLNDKLCMNLQFGGGGGFHLNQNGKEFSQAGNKKKLLLWETDINWANKTKKNMSIGIQKSLPKMKQSLIEHYRLNGGSWQGKKHTEETKQQMSNSRKGTGIGNNNSQYGSFWITNGVENKKLKNIDVIPNGYYKGRKIGV